MTGLILKLSYNNPGESTVVGGICGSFFFLKTDLAVTAYHLLNKINFKPNNGFINCQYWIILEQDIVEIKKELFIEFPEVDTTFIKLEEKFNVLIRDCSEDLITTGDNCFNEGFIGGQMPAIIANWISDKLVIESCNYDSARILGEGFIKSKKILNIKSDDINIENVSGFETSYGGIQGMSGGPLISSETGKIIGIMSIGLPADIPIKESLFAIEISNILERMKQISN